MGIDPDRPEPTGDSGRPSDDVASRRNPAWTTRTLREVRPALVIDTAAHTESATRVRREFAAWLEIDVTGDRQHDLVLAVYEAVANIAEHAYVDHPDRRGPVRLLACRSRDAIVVTIADDGRWRAATGAPYRSRGLRLIRALVQDVHIDHTSTGTVVYLRATLSLGAARQGRGRLRR